MNRVLEGLYMRGSMRVVRTRTYMSRVRVLMDVPPRVDMTRFVKCLGNGDDLVVFSERTGLGCGCKSEGF